MAATGGGNQADSVHSFVSCVLRRRVPAEAPSTCGHCATVGQGRLASLGVKIDCESLPCPCLRSGGGSPPPPPSPPAQELTRCGVERWSVKTLTDKGASRVSFLPKPRTVDELRGLPAPAVGRNSPRLPGEFSSYRLTVRLRSMKIEDDSDTGCGSDSPCRGGLVSPYVGNGRQLRSCISNARSRQSPSSGDALDTRLSVLVGLRQGVGGHVVTDDATVKRLRRRVRTDQPASVHVTSVWVGWHPGFAQRVRWRLRVAAHVTPLAGDRDPCSRAVSGSERAPDGPSRAAPGVKAPDCGSLGAV